MQFEILGYIISKNQIQCPSAPGSSFQVPTWESSSLGYAPAHKDVFERVGGPPNGPEMLSPEVRRVVKCSKIR